MDPLWSTKILSQPVVVTRRSVKRIVVYPSNALLIESINDCSAEKSNDLVGYSHTYTHTDARTHIHPSVLVQDGTTEQWTVPADPQE